MKRISKAAIAAAAIWLALVVMGYQGIQGVVAQHAEGYPNAEQIRYYVVFPGIIAVVAALTGICLWFGRFSMVARIVQVLAFFLLVPYLLLYTGGV
ncbi:hypothetical protein [Methylibium sp.]|uniref:hypothetical protein n=1 Tax=Methylibium sp. TaxID=2067992 RepID=UPI003D145F14